MSRVFKITKIRDVNDWDYTIFLHDNLRYRDGELNHITFVNKLPFNTYKVGDNIDINIEEVAKHPVGSMFEKTSIINVRAFEKGTYGFEEDK